MTSPSPDLVERLREYERLERLHALMTNEPFKAMYADRADVLVRVIEALSAQQQEPVGEVRVVSEEWKEVVNFKVVVHHEPLVRKSSYDALAAAKDREIAELGDIIDGTKAHMDAFFDRAEAAERQRDALEAYRLAAEDHLQRNSQGSLNKLNRAREALNE